MRVFLVLELGCSTLVLLTFGGGSFFVVWGCPVPCTTLSSIPGHYLPGANSCDNQKRFQILPNVPWKTKSPPFRHCTRETLAEGTAKFPRAVEEVSDRPEYRYLQLQSGDGW